MMEGGELEKAEKILERLRNPKVYGVFDEGDLELGKDPVPHMTAADCFKSIGRKPITYNNSFPIRKQLLLSDRREYSLKKYIF